MLLEKKRLSLIISSNDSESNVHGEENVSSHQNLRRDWSQNSNSLSRTSRPGSPGSNAGTQQSHSSPTVSERVGVSSSASEELFEDKNRPTEKTQKSQSIDRSNDEVYAATTSVVKAIMTLSQGVEKACAAEYLDLVRYVGIELRNLLVSVDRLSTQFPPQVHKEVEMAHQVLSKDMHELVSAMRLAQQYNETTLDVEYRKSMLSAAHVLAMDAKNLLDVIDSIRARYTVVNPIPKQQHSSSQSGCLQTEELIKSNDLSKKDKSPIQNHQRCSSGFPIHAPNINEEGYQIMSHDGYENSISTAHRATMHIASSSPIGCSGIYDNECIINEHVRDVETNQTKSASNESGTSTDVGTRFSDNTLDISNKSLKPSTREPPDESLKIVEENTHMYCNLARTTGTEQLVHN